MVNNKIRVQASNLCFLPSAWVWYHHVPRTWYMPYHVTLMNVPHAANVISGIDRTVKRET